MLVGKGPLDGVEGVVDVLVFRTLLPFGVQVGRERVRLMHGRELLQTVDHHVALALREEARLLHRVDEQLQFDGLEEAHADRVFPRFLPPLRCRDSSDGR